VAQSGSGSRTEAYAYTKDTTEVTVVPRIITQSEQIARYFIEDLTELVKLTNIDLITTLDIPSEYARSVDDILSMLFDDLSHMLRDSLITGVQLLLSEPKVDPNTHAYPLRYHAIYTIHMNTPGRTLKRPETTQRRFNGHLAPPKNVWIDARFALLIDWNPTAAERRRIAHRPEYWFDWVPEQARFDATSLVRYREGGMTFDEVRVDRTEARSPGF
jgi:hypothetical protein